MGNDCSEEFDASVERAKAIKGAKLVNWTKYPIKSANIYLDWFGAYNANNHKVLNIANTGDDTWAIFPTTYYGVHWKRAVSRYSTYIVAVNSKEAYASGVIAKPETWKDHTTDLLSLGIPICPKGYSRTSTNVRFHASKWRNNLNHFKNADRHVHCLQDQYWIDQSSAKSKYGVGTVYDIGVYDRHIRNPVRNTRTTHIYVPNTYKYKSEYAEIDLSDTADTHYPGHFNSSRNTAQKLIDFGHPNFFFYGVQKNLNDAKNKR